MGQVEQRVETIAKKHGVSVRKAKETVKETDEKDVHIICAIPDKIGDTPVTTTCA